MVAAGWHRDGTSRRCGVRPQLEALEDRLAPSCTMPLVAQGELPFGIPVVACSADVPSAGASSRAVRVDISELGLAGAQRVTIVFHFDGIVRSPADVQYFDDASQSWRLLQARTQVADSFTVDAGRRTITVVFDETSTPTLAGLSSRMFRVTEEVIPPIVVVNPMASGNATFPLPSTVNLASGFFDMPPRLSAMRPLLDTRGVGVADEWQEVVQTELVIQTHAAFWTEPPVDAVDPAETIPPPPDSRPPLLDAEAPQFAGMIAETCAPAATAAVSHSTRPTTEADAFVLPTGLARLADTDIETSAAPALLAVLVLGAGSLPVRRLREAIRHRSASERWRGSLATLPRGPPCRDAKSWPPCSLIPISPMSTTTT